MPQAHTTRVLGFHTCFFAATIVTVDTDTHCKKTIYNFNSGRDIHLFFRKFPEKF